MQTIVSLLRRLVLVCCCVTCGGNWAGAGNPRVDHVIHISVDGLRGSVIEQLGPSVLPHLDRVRAEGAFTDNARTLYENTVTMPNHLSMITGRPRDGADGHRVTRNGDPNRGAPYVPGSVAITKQPGQFVRGTGALRIDDGSGPNYVRVDAPVLAGESGSTTSTVMAWYRYEDLPWSRRAAPRTRSFA